MEKIKYKKPAKCIVCGKKLKEGGFSKNYDMIEGAIIAQVGGGYGSRHDGIIFQIAVCDDCIDEKKPQPLYDYINEISLVRRAKRR